MLVASRKRRAISLLTVSVIVLVVLAASITVYLLQSSVPRPESVKPQPPEQQMKPAPAPPPAKGPSALPPPTKVVIKAVSRIEFIPSFVYVSVGSSIIWENVDDEVHTATSKNITAEGSPVFHLLINPGNKSEMKFDKPGTYYYECVIAFHTMSGIIRVSG